MSDDASVRLKSFGLKDITLNYKEIKSITSYKLIKHSKKTSIASKGIAFTVPFTLLVHAVMLKEWKVIIAIAPLLPLYFIVNQKQNKDYRDLNAQLYIESGKRWYKFTPYYSIVTDEISAADIKTAIEHYRNSLRLFVHELCKKIIT
ncbi:hypothetical protein [Methanococcoides burtonii]|uniref:hypothetical protein n=1 Tax=Methanococcoides burtonii TaxID=29291 RepID=UPI0012F6F8EE|nr:hypothetical protein [Methanococcoides burtonii]